MFSIYSNFSISRLNNAEITAFYINVQKAITTNDPSKLGVIGILPAFGSKLQELIDRVYVSQGSEFTAAMKAADDRRCLIFRRIRLRLQMVEVAEQNEALLAIQDVVRTHLLSKYVATVTSKAYQERTSILQGFILDLNEKLGDSGIATLGLAEDITALEDANNEFIAAYAQRTAEKAEGNMGVTLRLRDEMYDIYLQLIYTVQYLANSTDEANAEKATACQAFIAHVNVLLSDAKKRLEQRLSGGDTEESEGSNEGHTEPTEPTENGGSNEGSQGGSNGGGNGGSNSGSQGGSNGVGNGAIDGSNENNGGTSGGGNGGTSGGGNGGNSSDPNQPSEGGVVNGDEVSF